jgi:hypothetical protein
MGLASSAFNFPSPYQQYVFFQNGDFSLGQGNVGYWEIPSNPNWFNFSLSFFSQTTSTTCNPYALVLVSRSGAYPFTGYFTLFANTKTGNTNWTGSVINYTAGISPGRIDNYLLTVPAGLWVPLFVFNDNNITVCATFSCRWQSVGPSNVIWHES